jgi:hypothetical protein
LVPQCQDDAAEFGKSLDFLTDTHGGNDTPDGDFENR